MAPSSFLKYVFTSFMKNVKKMFLFSLSFVFLTFDDPLSLAFPLNLKKNLYERNPLRTNIKATIDKCAKKITRFFHTVLPVKKVTIDLP